MNNSILQRALMEADELLDKGYWCVIRSFYSVTMDVGPINHRGERGRHTSTRSYYITEEGMVGTVTHIHS